MSVYFPFISEKNDTRHHLSLNQLKFPQAGLGSTNFPANALQGTCTDY